MHLYTPRSHEQKDHNTTSLERSLSSENVPKNDLRLLEFQNLLEENAHRPPSSTYACSHQKQTNKKITVPIVLQKHPFCLKMHQKCLRLLQFQKSLGGEATNPKATVHALVHIKNMNKKIVVQTHL